MRVNQNQGLQSSGLNVYRINQSVAAKGNAFKNGEMQGRKDTVKISPLGKANGFMESLFKQKQMVTEKRNELIAKTLKSGESLKTISFELESFQEQLKNIDSQIENYFIQQAKEAAEKQKQTEKTTPKTEEELQQEQLNSIAGIAAQVDQIDVAYSAKTQLDREISSLQSEIKMDTLSAVTMGSYDIIDKKQSKLLELNKKKNELVAQVGDRIADVNKEVQEVGQMQPETTETSNEGEASGEAGEAQQPPTTSAGDEAKPQSNANDET